MRQIFSSARLETVEGVAKLLDEHGIETRITNGRSYRGSRRRTFSYRDNAKDAAPAPTLWIVFPDDQIRAREILREAGLIDSTRESYLPELPVSTATPASPTHTAHRIRAALLIVVVVLGGFSGLRACQQKPALTPPAKPAVPAPIPEDDPESHIVPVEVSL